jgi:hypothetical protein
MIGSALIILVIGDDRNQVQTSYTPWNIHILHDNKIKIFGITLGKTTIQDANQIFSSFPETRLLETRSLENNDTLKLLAIYTELKFGGLIADIELIYSLTDNQLQQLKDTSIVEPESGHLHLSADIKMTLLDTVIASLIYKPSIDYETDLILQRFGLPESEQKISANVTRWSYDSSGLEILIDTTGPDTFIYSLIEQP